MDVKKFSLAHGAVIESSAYDILSKASFHISDSDRLHFIVVTNDNEVWSIQSKSSRLIFMLPESLEVSAMTFLPSLYKEENCIAFVLYNKQSFESSLRIYDINANRLCCEKFQAFDDRVTSLTPVEPSLRPDSWSVAFGLENGSVGVLIYSAATDTVISQAVVQDELCRCPVTKLAWIKTRKLLVCGYQSGYLVIARVSSGKIVYCHSIDSLPISSIVSTEPENDPRLTCFIWISAANGRRSSAAIVFRVEGENDNVICMGVHDLAANIPDADSENAWAYLIDISSSKQFHIASGSDNNVVSSNLVSFLWEIGITGRSTDYYFAVFDINAWFSWQSQANLQLKEPVFGGSKFLAVFKLPKSVASVSRMLGAYAFSNSIMSFRPRVSIVPLTSPLLYPCSLSFDVFCLSTEAITRVRYKSLQETLLKKYSESDYSRMSSNLIPTFVEKLTTLGLIDMFDGSTIGCSHQDSVFNAFFKFASEGDAINFTKKFLQNDTSVPSFQNWLFYRAVVIRKDFDVSLDLAFQKAEAFDHLRAVKSDIHLLLRLVNCLPVSSHTFVTDLVRVLKVLRSITSAFIVFLKSSFYRTICFEALQCIVSHTNEERPFFSRHLKTSYTDVFESKETFVNYLTSNETANFRHDYIFLLLYTFLNAVPSQNELSTELLLESLSEDFQKLLGVPKYLIRHVALANFVDRKLPGHMIKLCLRLSRPLQYSPKDVLQLLEHLLQVDVDLAFEVSLQLLMVYKLDSDINWSCGVFYELFEKFIHIFVAKGCFDPPIQLCQLMPDNVTLTTALHYYFSSACYLDDSRFQSFIKRLTSASSKSLTSSDSRVDPLQECIKYMCTSKERLLVERACMFFAQRGMALLPEALSIANRANDYRFVSQYPSDLQRQKCVDDLISKRRLLIDDQLVKLPEYMRDRVVDKSRGDSMSWMFVPSQTVSFPITQSSTSVSGDDQTLSYKFAHDEVFDLLKLAPTSVLSRAVSVPSPPKFPTSSSFTGKRKLSVLAPSSQSRLSTAKKCRFVDPSEDAGVSSQQTPMVKICTTASLQISSGEINSALRLPEALPITPVVGKLEEVPKISVSVVEETVENQPIVASPVSAATAKKLAPLSATRKPSPAQKAAKKILRRSVRFSCSPKTVETQEESPMDETDLEGDSSVIICQPSYSTSAVTIQSEGVVEISSDDDVKEVEDDEEIEDEDDYEEEEEEEEESEQPSLLEMEPQQSVFAGRWGSANYEDEVLYMEEEVVDKEEIVEEEVEQGECEEDNNVEIKPTEDDDQQETDDAELYLSPMPDVEMPNPMQITEEPSIDTAKVEESGVASTSIIFENEPVALSDAVTARENIASKFKSVSNISPNRLAAQMALRRSIRVASSKKRQEIADSKKTVSSSLEENNEPDKSIISLPPSHQESPVEQSLPLLSVEKESSVLPEQPPEEETKDQEEHRASTPPIADVIIRVEEFVEKDPPFRLTRSRSVGSAPPAPAMDQSSVLNSSMTRRSRRSEVELLSQSSIASDMGGVTTRRRSRNLSGCSESAITSSTTLIEPLESQHRKGTRLRTHSAMAASDLTHEVEKLSTPSRRHVRRSLTPASESVSSADEFKPKSTPQRRGRKSVATMESTLEVQRSLTPATESVSSVDEFKPKSTPQRRGRKSVATMESAPEEQRSITPATGSVSSAEELKPKLSPPRRGRKSVATMESTLEEQRSVTPTTESVSSVDEGIVKSTPQLRARNSVATKESTEAKEVTELPPKVTRKRSKAPDELPGMTTPSSSPKRRARTVSASATKFEGISESESISDSKMQSAPSSPSRRTRRGAALAASQAEQLAAALTSVVDSPAFHTRRHNPASSRASSIQGGDTESTVGPPSPATSTVSTSSRKSATRTTRSTRSKTKTSDR